MSKKKLKPYDAAQLMVELAKITTMVNSNYSTTIDGARVEALELIIKHSADEKTIIAARDVLVDIAGNGAILVHHRVRAIKILLEGQKVIQTIDAANAQAEVES